MRHAIACLLCLGLVWIGTSTAVAEEIFISIVKSVEGGATITRGDTTHAVTSGMEVKRADIIRTDRNGHVGLVFSDDTRISIGPGTELTIDSYLFEPLENNLSFVLRLVRGTVSYLSGQIAKLAPEAVQLVLPAATIGVRGTHVLIKVD
ncbi:FecR family protein [Desulfatitalea alkaliphila]|uniref:FecR domain-containing protein n=1 Tax=Desulfatitalea alkaliphila TaxID=2929485 RepID=A0AA41QZV3_9BACT|nr:FecR domain-containing protein [Desulfatitalea alkaliphila]MCJ8499492.1 FecR domain-containing protein [Desulfatitalea alkaliphila]